MFNPKQRKEIAKYNTQQDDETQRLKDIMSVYMDEDEISEILQDKDITKKMLQRTKLISGYSPYDTIIMICKGINCPMSEICPLRLRTKEPEGKPCPIEIVDYDRLQQEYIDTIKEHLDLSDREDLDILLKNMALDIASDYLQLQRMNAQIAKEGMMRRSVIGINPRGDVVYDDKPHEGYTIIRELKKSIHTQLRNLLLTPEMREKYKRNRNRSQEEMIEGIKNRISSVVKEMETDKTDKLKEVALASAPKNMKFDTDKFRDKKITTTYGLK